MERFERSPQARAESFVRAREPAGLETVRVEPITGDASNRAYFRIRLRSGEAVVLALMPAPFEIEGDAFLSAGALFREMGIRVPEVLEVAGGEGALLLEDLGDQLLQDAAANATAEEKRRLYRQAVLILARLQRGARDLDPGRFVPLRTAFDAKKFYEELEFFRRHCLEGLRRALPGPSEREALELGFERIASELAEQPEALCHRDYHSRNLLCLDEGLAVIDFQDARRGPRCYDLASLLNDSYVVHAPALVAEMKELFACETGADVGAEYELAALQRNLKALGTFGYQIVERGNDVYRPYVAPTLELVRANLERNPRWDSLRRALLVAFPELA